MAVRIDYRPQEILIAAAVALGIQGGSIVALRAAGLHALAEAPEIVPGAAIPIRVKPVLDLDAPVLKLGGKPVKYKLPDMWAEQQPVRRVERKAFPTTEAGKSAEDIPPPEVEVADAGTEPPPPDAEVALQVDTPLENDTDAGPSNVGTEGSPDGLPDGTETDPLKARAVNLYRARLIAWFSSRFRVSGSGLSAEELLSYRVPASVELSSDRVVVGYSIQASGNTAFDSAARATLEGSKGQQLPPPPENYPDAVQNQISLTFVCRPSSCD